MASAVFQPLIVAVLFFSQCHAQGTWTNVDGLKFLYMSEQNNWDDALTSCINMEGTLATIKSADQLSQIITALNIDGNALIWIGANKKADDIIYVWAENNQPAQATLATMGENVDTNPEKDCIFFIKNILFNDDCRIANSYLCMQPGTWTNVDGVGFLFMEGGRRWDVALTSCIAMGGTLATIKSAEQLRQIKAALNIDDYSLVWIGANKRADGITYVWVENNQPAQATLATMWGIDNPVTLPDQDCVYFYGNQMYNYACRLNYYYLCMQPAESTTQPAETTQTTRSPTEATTQPAETTQTTKRPPKHCKKG